MTFQPNILKQELIQIHGQGYGTPLFSQEKEVPATHKNLPDWIWNGKEVSQEALRKFEKYLEEKAVEYLNAVLNLGGEATDNEVADFKGWERGYVSARRNSLMKVGIIFCYLDKDKKPVGVIGKSGSKNTVWHVNFKKLFMLTLD